MNWKILPAAFFLTVTLICSGCGKTSVRVRQAEEIKAPFVIEISSEAEALHTEQVIPSVSGPVTSELPAVGTKVEAGSLLFQIDASSYEAQAAALENQIASSYSSGAEIPSYNAENDDSMEASLLRQGIITRAEYEQIQGRKGNISRTLANRAVPAADGLKESLETVRKSIAACGVRAPIDGTVSAVYLDKNKIAAAGQTAMVICQDTPVIFSFGLPAGWDEFIERTKNEKMLTVTVFDNDHVWYGELKKHESNGNNKYTVYKVQIDNPEGELIFGKNYTVRLSSSENIPAVVIPKTALRGENTVAVVTDDSLIDIKTIMIGHIDGEDVYVLDGLHAGDRVVLHSSEDIEIGMPVTATTMK